MELILLIIYSTIVAPSSSDVRAMNYVIPIVPRVTGQVTEVPIEPNRPIKKGDVLFKLDPVPFQLLVKAAEATLAQNKAKLVTAEATESQVKQKLSARTATGEIDEVATAKAQIAKSEADLSSAQYDLDGTTHLAPADGRVANLALRPGVRTTQFATMPVMSFIEDNDQWVLA